MNIRALQQEDAVVIEVLFRCVFAESESAEEGALVGGLVRDLVASIDGDDVCGFGAVQGGQIVGGIFFSRLTFDPPRDAFLLSPVAVHSDHQRKGIGQALITHGLRELAGRGVRFVATYGDPAYYSKVGFEPVSADVIRPPHKLSQPAGWLGQSLANDEPLASVSGQCACVQAFDNPALW